MRSRPGYFYGYRYCAMKMGYIIKEKKCFDAFNNVLNDEIANLVAKNCTTEAVENYMTEFKKFAKKDSSYVKQYEDIKNDHIRARLCTIKIVNFVKTLDRELNEATQKLNAREADHSRETASRDGQ